MHDSISTTLGGPFRILRPEIATLGVAGGIAVAVSMLLIGSDWMQHAPLSPAHFAALAVSALVAALAGLIGRDSAPWFGWLAYGVTMASAVIALPLVAAIALTGSLPADPNVQALLALSLLLLACALPALLFGRRLRRRNPR